ncbi:MAG: hypothetical protein R3C59_00950 [Planctomycetaceae bacterium]
MSRDGKWLVSGGVKNDGSANIADSVDEFFVVIWSTDEIRSSGTPGAYRQLKGEHPFRVTAAAFSPDGKQVITAGRRGRFVLWDFENNKVLARADNGHGTDGVTGVFFSSDDEFISAGFDGNMYRWRQEGEKLVATLIDRQQAGDAPDYIVRLRPSPDGSRFVTSELTREKGGDTYRLKLNAWSSKDGWQQTLPVSIQATNEDKDKPYRHDLSWSTDGREVLYVHDGAIRILDSATWKVTKAYSVAGADKNTRQAVRGVFAPGGDGKQQIATFDGRFARMWDLETGNDIAVFRSHGPVVRAGFSADRKYVATASDSIRLFHSDESSPDHGRTVFRLPRQVTGPSIFDDIAFSPKAEDYRFATVDVAGAVKIWNWSPDGPPPEKTMMEAPAPVATLPRELRNARVTANSEVCWSPNANRVAAVQRGQVQMWQITDGKLVEIPIPLPEGAKYVFNCLSFSTDNRFLSAGGIAYDESDRRLRCVGLVWDLSGETVKVIGLIDARTRHSASEQTRTNLRGITAIAFDSRQNEIITGGADTRVLRWQMVDPELMLDPNVPEPLSYLVEKEGTPGDDFNDPHTAAVTSLDVAADGRLVSADEAGFIVIWPAVD